MVVGVPRYDLQCAACTNLWEAQRGMNAPNPPCPQCGSTQVEQLINTGTQFVLKGSGWAATNYSKETKD